MCLRLQVLRGQVSVLLNGIAVLRAQPAGRLCAQPVHEFLVTGNNLLGLQVEGKQAASAQVQLLLVPDGRPVDAEHGRLLAELAIDSQDNPVDGRSELQVELPVNFPRWRWLDLIPAALGNDTQGALRRWFLDLAADLTRGQFTALLEASRLRCEELAAAYREDVRGVQGALETQLKRAHAAGGLVWSDDLAKSLQFAPLAEGRLLECLDQDGLPALSSKPDENGIIHRWPLRVALFEDRIHVLR